MTLKGAIKQLHDLQSAEDMPFYYKPAITEVINVLVMDAQEVIHGYWIDVDDEGSLWRCSVCGETQCCYDNYCGNCGARMEGKKMETTKINPVEIETKIMDAQGNELVPVRHGHWIENDTTYAEVTRQTCTCSVCGRHSPRPLGEFCRWCGAKMDEDGKDLVDEQPTVDVESIITKHEDIGYEKGYRDGYAEALEVTEDAKPVKHGHWIGESQTRVDKLFFPSRVFKCSVCGNYLDFDGVNVGRGSANYCPNCGAKMSREEENKYEEPEINPCRRCEDYDGKGRCLSHGGCGEGEKMYEATIDKETGLPVTDNSFARVVRCKDCKYLNIINEAPIYACCSKHNHIFYPWEEDIRNHFCSWGAKMDERK